MQPVAPLDLRIPMSDGALIAVHRYPAPNGAPAPAVLMTTPYMKEGNAGWARRLNECGYEALIADVRGINGSQARYEGLFSEREIQDGAELVEWIARQPFCDGGVALGGASYCGANQLLIAARQPKGLRCIAPTVSPVDTYRDMFHRGAMPTHVWWPTHTYLPSRQTDTMQRGLVGFFNDVLCPPCDNEAHRRRSPEAGLTKITCPVLCLGGWHDYFLRGTIRVFNLVSGPKRLVVGPWGHCESDAFDELIPWLDYWLRGRGPNPTTSERVRLFRTGIDRWESRDDWVNTARMQWQRWHLITTAAAIPVHANISTVGAALNPKRQHAGDARDGISVWAEDGVFDGEPVTAVTDLTGPIGVRLVMCSSECRDLDLRVRLSVVAADGSCLQLVEGRLRASHRATNVEKSWRTNDGEVVVPWHEHEREELLPLGESVAIDIEVDPICHRMKPGDRLRLGITVVRADDVVPPSSVIFDPQTRVLLPVEPHKGL